GLQGRALDHDLLRRPTGPSRRRPVVPRGLSRDASRRTDARSIQACVGPADGPTEVPHMGWRSKKENGGAGADQIENVLGRSLVVHGDLKADGAFRVDGTVEGSVVSKAAVYIGESGVVRGDVAGSDVVIAGQVAGNVRCTGHLEIVATGKIEGDLDAQSVRIETGGVFRGTSRMAGQDRGSNDRLKAAG